MKNPITAFKENNNNFRKRVVVVAAVSVGVIATAVVLSKMKDTAAAGELYDVLDRSADGVLTLAPSE